jgi:hypothetical protein
LASALSLGPIAGSTVVGRPLELMVPIQFDALAQGNGSGCVAAKVFYGDRAMGPAQVDVQRGADASRQSSRARITTTVPVDEPFVTVVLSAGCDQPLTKRYVLLADAPAQEPMALAAAQALGAPARAAAAGTPAPVPPAPRTAATVSTARVAAATPRAERALPVRRAAPPVREAAASRAGRLQLAVWDPNSERLPWLRTSSELVSSPTADAARRAAAASLWRALNAQPQDLLRTAERLRGLEGELGSLRTLSDRHRADIASARDALQAAQAQRHTSLLLVTVLALLAGSAAAFFWHRARRPAQLAGADSWYGPLEPVQEPVPPALEPLPEPEPAVPPRAETVLMPKPLPVEEAVRHVPPAPPPPALAPMPFTLPDAPPSVALPSAPDRGGLRIDALQGAQQQAEFFASLGQVDEAVAVLKSYLEETRDRPPLAFLELFRIYHGTGMRVEYEELQSTFRQTFGMDVASFGEYSDEPRELDLFLLPVTRIASAWPSERSLEIIEELLFKRPANPRDLLSLEAYRDLVWLYTLAQELVHHTGPAGLQLLGDRGLPNDHFILPWALDEHDAPTELSLDRLDSIDVAPELNAFGVDIDLTAIRGDGHPLIDAVHLPEIERAAPAPAPPPLAEPPSTDFDAFDAAMESESRRHR